MKSDQKGITLISLIVTVVVLMLLLLISIRTYNGMNDEIIDTEEMAQVRQIQEQLELEKTEVSLKKRDYISINDYLDHLVKNKIIDENDIEDTTSENAKKIVVDGYVFLVEENDMIKITYEGELK